MTSIHTDIIDRLKKEILPQGGLRPVQSVSLPDLGFGALQTAFPQGNFPLGAIHEFISLGPESSAATTGFISGIMGSLMKKGGAVLWIGDSVNVYPPALQQFGIHPERVIFIDLQKEKDILWAMEEALKCSGLAAVVCEINGLSFTDTRRFQLAVEQSLVTGFIIRLNPRNLQTNACVSRWKIKPLPTGFLDDLPGIGFPRWEVELLKMRNGRPGTWQFEWSSGRFHLIEDSLPSLVLEPERKTG
jgi:protein ImuA